MVLLPPAPSRSTLPLAGDLAAFGDRVALVAGDEEISYADLDQRVGEAVEALGGGRRLVVVAVANEVEPLVHYLAALRAGHPVVLAPADQPRHVESLVAAYDADVVVAPAADGGRWMIAERREGSAHDLHPDLALLLSTSGSTGSPKLVRLSADNVQANAESIVAALGIRPTDRAATTLPMHYCYGLSVVHSHLAAGAGLLLTGNSVVDPCFWAAFERHGGTTLAGVPHTFDLLDRVGFPAMSVPSLRSVTQAGGRLAPERVRAWAELGRARGFEFVVMYGQTEATARMACLPPDRVLDHPGAIGLPVPGGSFEIEPVDGADDGSGELLYRGPNVMMGYAEQPTDLAAGRTVDVLRTGDLARRTPDGLYELVGRRSRFVKLFGLRIDLQQVEAVLAGEDVNALCAGDDEELVVAVDVAAPADARVRQVVADHVGLPAGRVRVCRYDELPRLASGKPDLPAVAERARLDRAAEGVAAEEVAAERSLDGAAAVRALFADVLQTDRVDDDSTFVGLGGDSLSYVEASIRLESVLGTLPPGWHTTPVGRLGVMVVAPRRVKRVETNVVLRAAAITLVVGFHTGLFGVQGGAHVLLLIAGFNFARFQLGALRSLDGVGSMVASAARIAVPAMVWLGLLVLLTDDYGVANVFLLHGHLGPPEWDPRWRYWFLEVIVQILVVLAGLFAVPAVRRLERRRPFGFVGVALLVGLATRFVLVEAVGIDNHMIQPYSIFWLFAAGWAAARATTVGHRVLLSTVVVLAVPGFFPENPTREWIVAAGFLLLVWVASLPVPRPLDRLVGPVASASLYTYLTHWQVFPAVLPHAAPWVAVLVSLAVGSFAAWVVQRVTVVGGRALRRLPAT